MGLLENLKDVASLAQRVGEIELYKKIVDLEGEVRNITRENRQLEDHVIELEKRLNLRAAMTFKPPFYYQDGDKTPFCAPCFEGDEVAVHLGKTLGENWLCMRCNRMFSTKGANENRQSGYDIYTE